MRKVFKSAKYPDKRPSIESVVQTLKTINDDMFTPCELS